MRAKKSALSQHVITRLQGTFVLFVLLFNAPVNSYGHAGTVSTHNHTFSCSKLEQADTQFFVHIHSLVTDNKEQTRQYN